jgi:hypothetical protein
MSNSLNLVNIKNLLAAAYLAGVHDAFEKSKGLDTNSLQKNLDDSLEFREILIAELKSNGIEKAESILINAKSKGKELFCQKYPDEYKCKSTTPTNKKEETGILASLTSFFTGSTANTSKTKNVSLPSMNVTPVNSTPKVNVLPSTIPTTVNVPPPSSVTVVNVPPPTVATPNASTVNPMIQTPTGGKRKSK